MGAKKDLTGHRFGKLVALEDIGRANGGVVWKCQCDCGSITQVRANHLVRGLVVSCGCYNREVISKHNMTNTAIYSAWQSMKNRCENPNAQEYRRYGGRGIRVCDEWSNNSEAFIEWALANGWERGLSLDRIDNDGDYEPDNCRWVTMKTQGRNRSNCCYISDGDETHCLSEWAEILNEPYAKLVSRHRRGWSDKEVLHGREL